jgi:hypothetical protein
MTVERGMDATRYSAQVTDVASQARWRFPLHYAQAAPGAVPYPVAVRADGTVHWAAGRAAVVAAS